MDEQYLFNISQSYLSFLCNGISERCVGSEGNRSATAFFRDRLHALGWVAEVLEFDAIDWIDGGATLKVGTIDVEVFVSSYSKGCSVQAPLAVVDSVNELERGAFQNKILLLYGDIAKEQLMPKNFVFYNPEEHRRIISLLEESNVQALICAPAKNPVSAGGLYPYPLIEDGDFEVPSVYMSAEEGMKLLPYSGEEASLTSVSERIPGKGYNVIGKRGENGLKRVVISAHIDAKKGTPGATDNATGVVVLLLLAELLKGYSGNKQIELVAFNGEDYFTAPGQMEYIKSNREKFDSILLNINIDGVGYKEGKTTFSFFHLPLSIRDKARIILKNYSEITEGAPWYQGDHSIFIQQGRPAIAVSSQRFIENSDNQDITHTPKDNPEIVDIQKVVDTAEAVHRLICAI